MAFDEVYNYLASGCNSSGYFDAISFADATVIDTRSSSDRSDDVYDNEITPPPSCPPPLSGPWMPSGELIADVYVQDGEIVFVAVTEMVNSDSDEDDDETDPDLTAVLEDVQKALNRTSYELEDVTASAVRAQIEEAAETAIQDTENEYKVSVFLNDYTQPENVGDVATVTATITVTVGDESDTVDVLVSIEKIASSTGDGAETGD